MKKLLILFYTLTQNNNSHAVEDRSNVCQEPQKQCELEWVNEILHKEKTTQFGDVSIDMSYNNSGDILDLFWWQSQVDVQEFSMEIKF